LLKESKEQLDGWYRALQYLPSGKSKKPSDFKSEMDISKILNDLNTAGYISFISRIIPQLRIPEYNLVLRKSINKAANLLGLLQKDPEEWFKGGLDYDALVEEYDAVRTEALAAKAAGDKAKMGELFKRSDEIRDQFKEEGVVIESGPGGKSSWRKA
jgi:cysteinyl-tRNA synthetase